MMLSVLACREGSPWFDRPRGYWVVQAIEQDVASQGDSLLGALADLGRMFDARDQLIADSDQAIAPNPLRARGVRTCDLRGPLCRPPPARRCSRRACLRRDLSLRAEGTVITSPRATGAPHSARAVKVPSCKSWAVCVPPRTQVTSP